MKPISTLVVTFLALLLIANNSAYAGNDDNNAVIPVIRFDNLDLKDGITALAKQAGRNIQFDAALLNRKAADGSAMPLPTVTFKWTKVTALQALEALLDNYGWQMTNETGAATFRVSTAAPKSGDPRRTVVNLASLAGTDTAPGGADEIVSEVRFDGLASQPAISALATAARLNIIFDPRLASGPTDPKLTVKWNHLTALQALQKLFDRQGLQATQIPGNPILRIAPKSP